MVLPQYEQIIDVAKRDGVSGALHWGHVTACFMSKSIQELKTGINDFNHTVISHPAQSGNEESYVWTTLRKKELAGSSESP
jgi:hypothetical protein